MIANAILTRIDPSGAVSGRSPQGQAD